MHTNCHTQLFTVLTVNVNTVSVDGVHALDDVPRLLIAHHSTFQRICSNALFRFDKGRVKGFVGSEEFLAMKIAAVVNEAKMHGINVHQK